MVGHKSVQASSKKRSQSSKSNSSILLESTLALLSSIRRLQEQYNFSPDIAKSLSVGVKGFVPNKIIGDDGRLKTGGSKKAGMVDVDFYSSYRLRTQLAHIAIVLEKGAPLDQLKFIVSGNNIFDPEDKPKQLCELRTLPPSRIESTVKRPAILYKKYSDAIEHFEKLIKKMNPPRH
jgi:hypothetical protein